MERPSIGPASTLPRLLLLGALWGATFPIARVGVDAGANPFLLVTLDLLLAAAVMAPIAALQRSRRPKLKELLRSSALGALLIAGINLPLFWGLRYATGGSASLLYATSPMISLIALWLLGSSAARLGPRQTLALVVGLGGVALLAIAGPGGASTVAIAALGAFGVGAVCQGVGAVLVGRARPAGEDAWGLTFQFVGGAAVSLLLMPILARSPALPITAGTVGSIAYVGVVSMAIGYSIFFDLVHRAGAVRANQVTFLNPVVAVSVGVFAFAERADPLELVALAVILVALVLLQPGTKGVAPHAASPGRPLDDGRRPSPSVR